MPSAPPEIIQVYIVDDNESVGFALKNLLMSFDFEVTTFNSAKSFFDSVSKDDRGCLVLDIHMPEMDGWETLSKIVASGAKRPVIFISAVQEDITDRALKAGAVGFLRKPFDGQALVDLINATSDNERGSQK